VKLRLKINTCTLLCGAQFFIVNEFNCLAVINKDVIVSCLN